MAKYNGKDKANMIIGGDCIKPYYRGAKYRMPKTTWFDQFALTYKMGLAVECRCRWDVTR